MRLHAIRAVCCTVPILLAGCIGMDVRPTRPPVPYEQARPRVLGNVKAAAQAEAPPGSRVAVELTEGRYVDTSGWVLFHCTVRIAMAQGVDEAAYDGLNDRLSDRIGAVIAPEMATDQPTTRKVTLDVQWPPKPKPKPAAAPADGAAPAAP